MTRNDRGAPDDQFDYVIIGAGSAGCVLANRLSEDPSVHVCVIEAGPRDRHPLIHVPIGILALLQHKILNWRLSSTPQATAAGRSVYLPRGRALGGSSSINGMIYTRGHPTDYDDWAAAGNPGWSYREVLPYFRRSENNETWRNSIYHGVGGPMNVAEPVTLNPMVDVLFEATDSLQFRRSVDFCGENMEGFGVRQLTQRNGRRESTATAFLNPARRRSNLTIITNALVDRIALDGTNATGVALITKNGEQRHLTARREVLLAAGAIASPMILMRSGIGDGTKLQTAGVPVAHHLRGVGRNLQEHVTAPLQYRSDSTLTYGLSLRIAPRMAWSAIEYLLFHRGLLSTNGVQAGGFIRSCNLSSFRPFAIATARLEGGTASGSPPSFCIPRAVAM
jgi:choline dehydrogenase-like flavoprotein